MKFILWSLLVLFPAFAAAQSFDTVRVCTYNVLNFATTTNTLDRIDEFRGILNEIQPDILLVQELENEAGKKLFEDSVASKLSLSLTPISGTFRTEQDSYGWIYYDARQFVLKRTVNIEDRLRDQTGVILTHRFTGDSIVFITMHWKAGDTPEDEEQRERSGQVLLEQIRLARLFGGYDNIICGGDMNVYTADEMAYKYLLFELSDPINRRGNWHNNIDYADIHTQSSRVRQFGGGVGGGLDDRFDQILLAPILTGHYLPGSYTTFGNDGNHFNDSINAVPNTAVSPQMAQALHDASDHLPVYLDLLFEKGTVSVEDQEDWGKHLLDLW